MKSKREAFATHLGLNFSETEDNRYHYGHTSQPVWAFEDAYYCVTKGTQKPATHRSGLEWDWKKVKNDFLKPFGFTIWISKVKNN